MTSSDQGSAPSLLSKALIAAVRGYQLTLSPYLGSQCRFTPTCSHYMMDALRLHGSLRGTYLGMNRLLRCHPWCDGGWDPVPHAVAESAPTELSNSNR